MHRTSALWRLVGVQYLKIILVDLVLEDLVLLVCHHVIETACAFLIKELTKTSNQARFNSIQPLIGRNYAGIRRICTLQHDSSIIFQVLVVLQAALWSFGDSPHSIQWWWTDSKIWKGGGWWCLAPCMPPVQLVKFIAMLLSWHAGSHALLLLAWPTWIHQAGHVQWLSERGVAGTDLWQATCWKLASDERLIIPTCPLINPQFSNFPISMLENYTLL